MSKGTVLISTAYLRPEGPVDRKLRAAGYRTVFHPRLDRLEQGERLDEIAGDAVAIIAGTERLTARLFDAAPRLRIVARTGAGYDNVDIDAATDRGVLVTSTPGVNSISVAEMAVALMLCCARQVPQNAAEVRSGRWGQPSGRELHGATIGLAGLGAVGRSVAAIAQGLGMRVIASDPFVSEHEFARIGVESASLDALLAESDIVSLHLRLDDSTRHLLDATRLSRMKRGAILINTARGGLVDEEALADAIESGRLAAAGLDVVETEPLPAESRLRSLPSVIVTAHIAGATAEARRRSSLMAADQVIDHLEGREPAAAVNLAQLAAGAGRAS